MELKTKEQLEAMSDDELLAYKEEFSECDKKEMPRDVLLEFFKASTEADKILKKRYDGEMRNAEIAWKDKVKPCPFCGGHRVLLRLTPFDDYGSCEAFCDFCGVTTPWISEPDEAYEFWNDHSGAEGGDD